MVGYRILSERETRADPWSGGGAASGPWAAHGWDAAPAAAPEYDDHDERPAAGWSRAAAPPARGIPGGYASAPPRRLARAGAPVRPHAGARLAPGAPAASGVRRTLGAWAPPGSSAPGHPSRSGSYPHAAYRAEAARDMRDAGAWEMSGPAAVAPSTSAAWEYMPPLAAAEVAGAAAVAPRTRLGSRTRGLFDEMRRGHGGWGRLRAALVALALLVAVATTLAGVGEARQAIQPFRAASGSKPTYNIALRVHAITSLLATDQYDSKAQYDQYSPAACSPTAMAMVLQAWGVQDATIGHMIDALGPHLSGYAGLLDQGGFQYAAAKYHYRADVSWSLSYNQVLYLSNTLGIPVIVNFRRDYGYYRYLSGGHFLVVTGGDQNGVHMADGSEYYIKYLTKGDFMGLWQWKGDGSAMTVVLVPEGYHYTLPNV